MKSKRLFGVIAFSVLSIGGLGGGAVAQDATPATTCVAPAFPPGTPTAMDDASPVNETDMDMDMGEMPMPAAESAASAEESAAATAALDNVAACFAEGDFGSFPALVTPNLTMLIAGTDNVYDMPVVLDGAAPMELTHVGEAVVDEHGRVGLPIVYTGIFNALGIYSGETWYFVEDDGTWKVDEFRPSMIPDDVFPDATVVTVQMVDYAFALDANVIPAGPVIFRISNTSASGQPHVGAMVILATEIPSQDIIQAEALPEDQVTGFVNGLFLLPGQAGDFYVSELAPGAYTLICDVTTPDGTPHWMLGMVANFTVE